MTQRDSTTVEKTLHVFTGYCCRLVLA